MECTVHNEKYSITRVALILNCSPATIKRWYKWAEKTGRTLEKAGLPQFTKDNRGTWIFEENQVNELFEFRKNIKRGQMADFNERYYWSKKKGEPKWQVEKN